MKTVKVLMKMMLAVVMACTVGVAFGSVAGLGVMGAALIGLPQQGCGVLHMAVTPEIWEKDVVENLFKNNEFLLKSIDESQYVVGGSCVHIPQAGAPSGAMRNRTSLPATIKKRTDTDVTYALDEITTDPRFIPNAEVAELSYDKRASVLMEDQRYINQLVADAMLYNWKAQYWIKASGAAKEENLAWGSGTRTSLTYDDFVNAKTIFNQWNMPKEGRYVILDTEMYKELCDNVKSLSSDNLTIVYDPITGLLKKLEGFEIYERSTVLLASAVSTLSQVAGKRYFQFSGDNSLYTPEQYLAIEDGTSQAANTACLCGLFWSDLAVSRAVGDVKMYENIGDPTYYGDIYSFLVRCGGRQRRGDGKGVLGLTQTVGA